MNINKSFLLLVNLAICISNIAQNPIIQTHYTADPAPLVYNNRVYLYTSHDEDQTVNNFLPCLIGGVIHQKIW